MGKVIAKSDGSGVISREFQLGVGSQNVVFLDMRSMGYKEGYCLIYTVKRNQ